LEKSNQNNLLTARIAGFTLLFYIAVGLSGMAFKQGNPGSAVIAILTSLSALVLGVTFYSITNKQQQEIAMMGLVCRVVEAVPGEGAVFFAVASTCFSWLLYRGRLVPVPLALLGIFASVLLLIFLPIQHAGYFGGAGNWNNPVTWGIWFFMLVYEIWLGIWLMVKGIQQSV